VVAGAGFEPTTFGL